MRLPAALLACFLSMLPFVVIPAAAQDQSQKQEQPSGQTFMERLMGNKNLGSTFDLNALGETQEQHDHYIHKNPDAQPITSNTVHNGDDD